MTKTELHEHLLESQDPVFAELWLEAYREQIGTDLDGGRIRRASLAGLRTSALISFSADPSLVFDAIHDEHYQRELRSTLIRNIWSGGTTQ